MSCCGFSSLVPFLGFLVLFFVFPEPFCGRRYYMQYTPTSGLADEEQTATTTLMPEFDGPTAYPGTRSQHALADCSDGTHLSQACLFGGHVQLLNFNCDLWAYDAVSRSWEWKNMDLEVTATARQQGPSCWGDFSPGSPGVFYPGGRFGHNLVRVPTQAQDGAVILFGGHGFAMGSSDGELQDLWVLDLATWSWHFQSIGTDSQQFRDVDDAGNYPGSRRLASLWAVVDDEEIDVRVLVFGGLSGSSIDTSLMWTYHFDNPLDLFSGGGYWNWSASSGAVPVSRYGASHWMAPNSALLYVFSGYFKETELSSFDVENDHWELVVNGSSQFAGSNHPGGRDDGFAAIAHAPNVLKRAFLFGGFGYAVGQTSEVLIAEMWEWDASSAFTLANLTSTWEEITDGSGDFNDSDASRNAYPSKRYRGAVVVVGRTLVFYGGKGSTGWPLADCWQMEIPCSEVYLRGNLCQDVRCDDGHWMSESGVVCSGHGACTSTNLKCQCSRGWGGNQCGVNVLLMTGVLAGGIGGFGLVIVCVIVVLVLVCCCCRMSPGRDNESQEMKQFLGTLTEDGNRKSYASLNIHKSLFEVNYSEIKVKKSIGIGGSSAMVFRAKYAGQEVAFKVFRLDDFLSQSERFQEFEKEVEVISSLTHRNILRFLGACLSPPRVGYLMEFCANGDLKDYIIAQKCSTQTRLELLRGTAAGMLFLHGKNVIHRDLKPENVLIADSIEARICDFGVSRILEKIDEDKTRTSFYMAPEIFLQTYGLEVDVFSYGIMMFTTLSGNFRPYGDVHRPEVKVSQDPTFRPRVESVSWNEDLEWCVDLMQKCWDHAPESRPTFQDIIAVLTIHE